MSTLQWQFGGVQVSFDNEVPVPSYISFEKDVKPPKTLHEEDDEDEDNMLTGGAFRNWENIHHRYRVVASAEVTEQAVFVNNTEVNFGNEPRNGEWALQNMPLPRQVVAQMLANHPEALNAISPATWLNAVREVSTKPRGFDRPLECTIEGPGEQKWVVKRMRDIGQITPQQRAALERSPGRIRGNMFWFAERQWEFIRRVIALNVREVNELLKPEVLHALQSENLPIKSKDVFPRNFEVLFRESWLQVVGGVEEGGSSSVGSSPDLDDGSSPDLPHFPPGSVPPGSRSGSESGSPPGSATFGAARSEAGSPPGSARLGSATFGAVRSASGSPPGSVHIGYGSPVEEAPPIITGGDGLSSETGFYGSVKRWTGNFQQIDAFRVTPGYQEYMLQLYTEERQKLEKSSNQSNNFILQEIDALHASNKFETLFPLLYLLKKGLYAAPKEKLIEEGLLDATFETNTLFSLCQDSLLELKSTEVYSNIVRVKPDYSRLRLVTKNEGNVLFELQYLREVQPRGMKLTLYYSKLGAFEGVVNYLPVLLYQLTLDNEFSMVTEILFKMDAFSYDQKRVVSRIFGPAKTTLNKLKQQLFKIQEDFGFYKLNNKQRETAATKATNDLVCLVFAVNRRNPDTILIDDIETWITGGTVQSRVLPYTIVKHASDIHKYPWIYTASSETNFEATNHIKIDLVCRRKTFVDVQGVGLSLMLYFTALAEDMYYSDEAEKMMILIDVTRTPTDAGLPDPMFCQVLHERLKFQRTFEIKPLLQEFTPLNQWKDVFTEPIFEAAKNKLMSVFDIEKHAPYKKMFKPRLPPQFFQSEFIDLPNDLDPQNLDDETQELLSVSSKTFTFIRPMFTKEDIYSIYNRFIQSVVESNKNVQRGQLDTF